MKQGIAICGNIFVDHVKQVEHYPQESMLAPIRSETLCVGGCVSNTGISIAKLDPNGSLKTIGAVGNDVDGRFVLDYYRRAGIDTCLVKVEAAHPTGYTDVISSVQGGTRTFFNCRGVNAYFGPEDIPYEKLDCEIFHIGYALLLDRFDETDPEYGTVMARTLHKIQSMGIKTSMDVVSEDGDRFQRVVTASLRYCDYLIFNEVEGGKVTGINPVGKDGKNDPEKIRQICESLMDMGVRESVVIHCREGGFLMDKSRALYSVKSLVLPTGYVKGSVGAGDAFCGGVLYGLLHHKEPEALLRLGVGTAAACLSQEDSVSGIEGLSQVEYLLQQYSTKDNE